MSLAEFRNVPVPKGEISRGLLSDNVSRAVREQLRIVQRLLAEPLSLERNFVKDQFDALVSIWKTKSRFMSDPIRMIELEEYQRIIKLGRDTIPLLLRELRQNPDHWFHALEQLTGETPVNLEHAGQIRAMADDWVQWGKQQRLI